MNSIITIFIFLVIIVIVVIAFIVRIIKNTPAQRRKDNRIGILPSAPERNRRSNKQFIPNEIDLENIPYEPMPRSPSVYEVKSNYYKESHSDTDLFLVLQNSNWEITKNIEMEDEEKPDPFYREVRFNLGGTLFIDKSGKNNRFAGCKSSLLKRGRSGEIIAEKGLEYDIYRIGTNPLSDWCLFMSSEGILHGYDDKFNNIFLHDLKTDPRIKSHYETAFPTWGSLKTHIRTIDINIGGNLFLFTIADTAWCLDREANGQWGISMPLNEGWERVITKVKSSGLREDVFNALQELGLTLPVNTGGN